MGRKKMLQRFVCYKANMMCVDLLVSHHADCGGIGRIVRERFPLMLSVINPWRACAATVTVVGLSVSLSVCLPVCLRLFSHYRL